MLSITIINYHYYIILDTKTWILIYSLSTVMYIHKKFSSFLLACQYDNIDSNERIMAPLLFIDLKKLNKKKLKK